MCRHKMQEHKSNKTWKLLDDKFKLHFHNKNKNNNNKDNIFLPPLPPSGGGLSERWRLRYVLFFSSNQQNESFQLFCGILFALHSLCCWAVLSLYLLIFRLTLTILQCTKLYCITTLYISAFVFSCCFLFYLYLIFLEVLATIPGRKRFSNKVIINSVSVLRAEGEGRLCYLIFLVVRVVLCHGVGAW